MLLMINLKGKKEYNLIEYTNFAFRDVSISICMYVKDIFAFLSQRYFYFKHPLDKHVLDGP